jgi:hypothetical protein
MNAASILAFPGSRTLVGWWRQLSAYSPQALWVGHLLLHHIDALACLVHPCPADPFTRHLLGALTLDESRPAPTAEALRRLDERLHLGTGLLGQALRALARDGLVEANGSGGWRLTAAGQQARDVGEYPRTARERRAFHFAEPRASGGVPPHFLSLRPQAAAPAPAPEDWEFDPEVLRSCVARPAEWKRRYGFPEDVRAIPGPEEAPPWEGVMLDRAERLLAVLVPTVAEGAPLLLGFAARQDGWALHSSEPALVVRDDWSELFPELSGGTTGEDLAAAWRGWARSRGLPDDEAAACAVEARGERLRVAAPASLVARLKSARSDALKGEAWVLAGEGAIRQALLLDIGEAAG